MGCGSSKDGATDSPSPTKGKGGDNRKEKANPDQVVVQVNGSDLSRNRKESVQRGSIQTTNSEVGAKGRRSKNDQNYDDYRNNDTPVQESNDKGYKKRVREKLRTATAGSDIEELEKTISLFERSRLDDCGDLTKAQQRLRFLKLRRDLRDSIRRRHVGVLDRTIDEVYNSPYVDKLQSQLEAAERLRDHLRELNQYNHEILQMEQTTISELRSYQRPPSCVHDVMAGTYMLLGHEEDRLTDWQDIQCLLGKLGRDSLMRQVENFDTANVDDPTATRVKEILDYHDLDEVRAASNGAASFYQWSNQMVDKIQKDKQEEDDRLRREDEKQQEEEQQKDKGRKKRG